ncbi:MAG: hypothetical protein GYB65_03250 [Chloroflexi bacterium]|nr:hypothetical protein [Chloroflexota bacterium]
MHRSRILTLVLALLVALPLVMIAAAPTQARTVDEDAIFALVDAMEDAVLAADAEGYLALVDQSDPVFALEHTRWVEDWADGDLVEAYDLTVSNITVTGDEAQADLTVEWAVTTLLSTIVASYPVRFTQDEAGTWYYAGEDWVTLEGDGFLIRAFAGQEDMAAAINEFLPDVYDYTTSSLDYVPDVVLEIKLYPDEFSLGANVLLSLPPIAGWTEPGEAIKMLARNEGPSPRVLSHEMVHFLTFEMADTSHGAFPWWVEEGIAEYVASAYWREGQIEQTLWWVQGQSMRGDFPAWETLANFEETPYEDWQYVYPGGFAFVYYLTETYGPELRNDWLWAMASNILIDSATMTVFMISFDDLDAAYQEWLAVYES